MIYNEDYIIGLLKKAHEYLSAYYDHGSDGMGDKGEKSIELQELFDEIGDIIIDAPKSPQYTEGWCEDYKECWALKRLKKDEDD